MIIKHKKFMDVAFLVTQCETFRAFPGGYERFYGEWINLGYVKSWKLNEYQVIDITDENKKNWLVCDSPDDECIRFSQWSPLVLWT